MTRRSLAAAVITAGLLLAGCGTNTPDSPAPTPTVEATASKIPAGGVNVTGMSLPEATAVAEAESYFSVLNMSKKRLVEMLTTANISPEDAAFAADRIRVDWDTQALLSAAMIAYMNDFTADEVRAALVREGFTEKQARAAISDMTLFGITDTDGLDSNVAEAVQIAEQDLAVTGMSDDALTDILAAEGYSEPVIEQALKTAKVNWEFQAFRAAVMFSYIEDAATRDGLTDLMTEAGFTASEIDTALAKIELPDM